MKPEWFSHAVKTQFISATSIQVSPLTDLQRRQKCKRCRKAFGDHSLPYMKCPTTQDWEGNQRYSKRWRFLPYPRPKTTKLLSELEEEDDD